jgi:8-oxo-dGTP diphosphatase
MKHIEVVAAVIIDNNKILCVQRGKNRHDYIAFKYEFPGGKIEPGETREEALLREIREELKMDITIEKDFLTVEHEYPDFKLTLHSFVCSCKSRTLTLTEHADSKWLNKEELSNFDWAAADIAVVNKIVNS